MRMQSKKKERVTELDRLIGSKVKEARLAASMTQKQLAASIKVTYQQIQKCENGTNRISASRLLLFSIILNKSTDWFYETAREHICQNS